MIFEVKRNFFKEFHEQFGTETRFNNFF